MADVIPIKVQRADLQPAVYHEDAGNNLNLLHLVGTNGRTEGGTPPITPPGTPPRTEGGTPPVTVNDTATAGASARAGATVVDNSRTEGGQGGNGGVGEGGNATATNGGNALNLNQKMYYAPPAVAYDSGHPVCGGQNVGLSSIFGGISFGNSKPDDRCWKFMEANQKQHLVDLACSAGINMATLAHDGYIKVADLAAQIVQRNPAARSEVAAMGALTTTEAIQSADLLKLCRDSLVTGLGGRQEQTVIGGITLDVLPPPAPVPPPIVHEAPPRPRVVHHAAPPKPPCETEDKVVKVCKIPHKPAGS